MRLKWNHIVFRIGKEWRCLDLADVLKNSIGRSKSDLKRVFDQDGFEIYLGSDWEKKLNIDDGDNPAI